MQVAQNINHYNWKHIWLTVMFLYLFFPLFAADYSPADIVNPNIADRSQYVADPGRLLSDATRDRVDEALYNLRKQTSAEVAVAVVPSIGDVPIEDFALQLFSEWGLGKADKDNGALLVIAIDQRRARIQTGYGMEGVLPDISAKKIIEHDIVPNMREGNLDAAVATAVDHIVQAATDPAVAEELRSSKGDAWESGENDITKEDLMTFVICVALAIALVALVMFIMDYRKARGHERYRRAMVWHHHHSLYWILAVCSLGFGLPVALLAEILYRRARNKAIKCPTCGTKMRKLNEEEDNQLLSPSQDFEEKLGTVDYDVWLCPECGSVERFAFKEDQKKYTECPSCHTIAMCPVYDHTILPATTRREGLGERVYECQYCHHRNNWRYRIPKKDDGAAAALAAGAILGAASGRGGSGGGGSSFGGGFGGGMSGGGGASGGW